MGFCKGDAYRVLLAGCRKVIESKDVTFFRNFDPIGELAEEFIACDLDADEDVILYDLKTSHTNAETGTRTVDEPQERGNIYTEPLFDEETSTAEGENNQIDETDLESHTTRIFAEVIAGMPAENLFDMDSRKQFGSSKNVHHGDIPTTYKEGLEMSDAEDWINTMRAKIGSLESLETRDLIDVPACRKVIRPIWLFDLKRYGKGNITRHKARLVGKSYSQIP